jgi:hypothetical protein
LAIACKTLIWSRQEVKTAGAKNFELFFKVAVMIHLSLLLYFHQAHNSKTVKTHEAKNPDSSSFHAIQPALKWLDEASK